MLFVRLAGSHLKILSIGIMLIVLSACNPTVAPSVGDAFSGQLVSPAQADRAYVYQDNPIILSGGVNFSSSVNFEKFINPTALFITSNSTLETDCMFSQKTFGGAYIQSNRTNCLRVLDSDAAGVTPAQKNQGTWIFAPGSNEFYQVQMMYHSQKVITTFLSYLTSIHEDLHLNSAIPHPPTLPYNLYQTNSFWFKSNDNQLFGELTGYSNCNEQKNAYFSPSDLKVCMGFDSNLPGFRFVQDPSVIYHEVGHALVKIMMNARNSWNTISGTSLNPVNSDLGSIFYDEAGSINEGIADYLSYMINRRTHFGEWALGRFYKSSRPLTEDDPIHAPDISTADDERLSYPHYLMYDPNEPEVAIEDIHYAGQITSHYLVALTEKLKNSCSSILSVTDKHKKAVQYVLLALSETLAELGDLNAQGTDYNKLAGVYFNNLNPTRSYLWAQEVNPANYRRFYQIMAKNIYHNISSQLCPEFDKASSEKLLDNYGLLLFNSYNDDGDSGDGTKTFTDLHNSFINVMKIFSRPLTTLTAVDPANRTKSVMVSKEMIELVNDPDKAPYFVLDSKSVIKKAIAALKFEGKVIQPTQGVSDPEYNNNNLKISPGEVVGVILNLKNKSNSKIAGVQVHGGDWDHMKVMNQTTGEIQPCVFNNWPLESEGGQKDTTTLVPGSCSYITRTADKFKKVAGLYPKDPLSPACIVQYSANNETKWVSQDFYRKNPNLLLQDKDCINNSSADYNPNECLVRVLPGAQFASMSVIDPQKTYGDTLKGNSTSAPIFNSSAGLLLEVNKWVPPGTIFNCRLRVRFSNCSDCYENSNSAQTPKDDYLDYEHAGAAPYKLINLQFTVTD